MDRIMEILIEITGHKRIEPDTPLLKNGILDSLGIARLIPALENAYGIEFNVDDILPENFQTALTIHQAVNRYREDGLAKCP